MEQELTRNIILIALGVMFIFAIFMILKPSPKPQMNEEQEESPTNDVPQENDADEQNKPTKACPFCGEEILAVAVKCKHCGSILSGSLPHVSNNSEIVGVIALVLPLCGTLLTYFWIGSMSLLNDPSSKLMMVSIGTILITSILIAIEANSVGAGSETDLNKNGKKGESPATWLIASLLVWILAFPWWMARRKKYGLKNYSVLAAVLALVFVGMSTLMHTVIEDAKSDIRSDIEQFQNEFEDSMRDFENSFNNM